MVRVFWIGGGGVIVKTVFFSVTLYVKARTCYCLSDNDICFILDHHTLILIVGFVLHYLTETSRQVDMSLHSQSDILFWRVFALYALMLHS